MLNICFQFSIWLILKHSNNHISSVEIGKKYEIDYLIYSSGFTLASRSRASKLSSPHLFPWIPKLPQNVNLFRKVTQICHTFHYAIQLLLSRICICVIFVLYLYFCALYIYVFEYMLQIIWIIS